MNVINIWRIFFCMPHLIDEICEWMIYLLLVQKNRIRNMICLNKMFFQSFYLLLKACGKIDLIFFNNDNEISTVIAIDVFYEAH